MEVLPVYIRDRKVFEMFSAPSGIAPGAGPAPSLSIVKAPGLVPGALCVLCYALVQSMK